MRIATLLLPGLVLILAGGPVMAQHVLNGTSETVLPGNPVTARVLLDNPAPVRGFSFGLAHDGTLLTLNSITEGAVVAASNGSAGPDFFFTDVTPAGGTGGVVGCVLSFSAPLDDIPIGVGNEIVLFSYTAALAAQPASVSSLDFVGTLGSPPVDIVIDVAGMTQIPVLNSGQVLILTPPVGNLSCTLTDVCECTFQMTWTNPILYNSIQILQDGVLVQTLPGLATSTVVDIGSFSTVTLGVVGVRNLQGSAEVQCIADCPVIPPPGEVDQLACSVDSNLCEATVIWNNTSTYGGVDVSLDGVVVQTLAGTATSTTVTLPGVGLFQICITSFNICGVASAPVCCSAECLEAFLRADTNADGNFNISDAIQELDVLFGTGVSTCDDAFDANDDDSLNLVDVFFILAALFTQGPLPGLPFPACGFDPTVGTLSCASYPACP